MFFTTLRPTFELHLPYPCDVVNRQVQEVLKDSEWSNHCQSFDRYSELHIPKAEIRYWSPHLSLHLDEDSDGTRVLGRFAPRQEVWTLVWFLYLALTFIAFFSSIFVFSMWWLGKSSWMGVVPLLAIAGIVTLHLVSRIGQQWSSDQMIHLRAECDLLFQQIQEGQERFSTSKPLR
jgi:hypothetical protein